MADRKVRRKGKGEMGGREGRRVKGEVQENSEKREVPPFYST